MPTLVPLTLPTGKIKLTYEDYLTLTDGGKRYEILEGGTRRDTRTHYPVSAVAILRYNLMAALEAR